MGVGPRLISDEDAEFIAAAGGSRPEKLGMPFTCWRSVRKLAANLPSAAHPVKVGRERLRQIAPPQRCDHTRTRMPWVRR